MAGCCTPFLIFGPSLPLRLEKKLGMLCVERGIMWRGVVGCNTFAIDLPVDGRNYSNI